MRHRPNPFLTFVVKEARHIVRDRRTMLILFGMPIVLMLIFGFAITNDVKNVRTVVVTSQMDHLTQAAVERLAASEYFNITRDILLSKSRKRQIVQARQIAMYECRNLIPNCSLSTIGAELGGKDHATVLHACTTVQDLMSTDKLFRQYVSDIEKMVVVPVNR